MGLCFVSPNIEGHQNFSIRAIYGGRDGCFYDVCVDSASDITGELLYNPIHDYAYMTFNARGSSTLYGNSVTIQPNSMRTIFIIRYKP